MPDFKLTDSLGNPVPISSVNWTSASSIARYAKAELFHLIVLPEFGERKDKPLSQANPDPMTFTLTLGHEFDIGGTTPEVSFTPGAQAVLSVNATAGSDLFDDDPYNEPADVPAATGYVGLSVTGTVTADLDGSAGAVTFGIEPSRSITFEYLKAFATGKNEPSLGNATAEMLSEFVIPAKVADFELLGVNDVCTVSGQGSLTFSGDVSVALPINPLASVNLPIGTGTLTVGPGVLADLAASFTLSGSYQVRVQKLEGGIIRLSYMKDRDRAFEIDATASAGVSVTVGATDYLAKLLGAIEKGKPDPALLSGLQDAEKDTFNGAIQDGINHSLEASLALALSTDIDHQAAFQYDIRPELLDADSTRALESALQGKLGLLTALEKTVRPDGTIAPGITLVNSLFTRTRTKGATLKINLLGIINLLSLSQLISQCEFLFEPSSGDLTIKETAQSEKISAITNSLNKQEALRKALFNSVLVTTTYVVSKAVTMPDLSCEAVHFGVNQNTNAQTMADYTNWFVALNLMTSAESAAIVGGFAGGGPSSCAMHTELDNKGCEALFFDGNGKLREGADYLEIGRQALLALTDTQASAINKIRYRFFDDATTFAKAIETGPSPQLAGLIPLPSNDTLQQVALAVIQGDLYDIVWWADGMHKAGLALQSMRAFLAGRDPLTLAKDAAFTDQRGKLQKQMLNVVSSSKARFHEPWGMVCLFRAAGSHGASGKLSARGVTVQKATGGSVMASAGSSVA